MTMAAITTTGHLGLRNLWAIHCVPRPAIIRNVRVRARQSLYFRIVPDRLRSILAPRRTSARTRWHRQRLEGISHRWYPTAT